MKRNTAFPPYDDDDDGAGNNDSDDDIIIYVRGTLLAYNIPFLNRV